MLQEGDDFVSDNRNPAISTELQTSSCISADWRGDRQEILVLQ